MDTFTRHCAPALCSLLLGAAALAQEPAAGRQPLPVLRTPGEALHIVADGRLQPGAWLVNPAARPDIYETPARHVLFFSPTDTLEFRLEKGQTRDFVVLTPAGDSAFTRIVAVSANPLEDPPERILSIPPGGRLSREQAAFDIDALVYTLGEVHPDLFATCRQADFFRAVNRAKATLPDSLTDVELFRRAAPLVTMIGDGHTMLRFPYNSYFTPSRLRLPMGVEVVSASQLQVIRSIDGAIPEGAEILAINGHSAAEMLQAMMPYAPGERDFFRLERIKEDFTALFEMLYAADRYEVAYRTGATGGDTLRTALPALTIGEIMKHMPQKRLLPPEEAPYSYRILPEEGVAVMDFRQCSDPRGMRQFADSLFATLRREGINDLIIDVRDNGGGSSAVADVLLRYLVARPFTQFSQGLRRISPTTQRLLGDPSATPGWSFDDYSAANRLIRPLTPEEGHFGGRAYLLTSHRTFSAAAAFAWAFKAFGAGTVVGEEAGGMGVSFGDFVRYTLPASRLACTISHKRFWHYGADEEDIHGALPDYAVASQEALEKALQLIRENR